MVMWMSSDFVTDAIQMASLLKFPPLPLTALPALPCLHSSLSPASCARLDTRKKRFAVLLTTIKTLHNNDDNS